MTSPISVVSFPSGLISLRPPQEATFDVPALMDDQATEVALDEGGLVHFRRAGGAPWQEPTTGTPLAQRLLGEAFFLEGDQPERDEHGWRVCRLCVREP